jgi:hypothetical protein
MATWTPRQFVDWYRNTAASTPGVSAGHVRLPGWLLVHYDLNDETAFEQLLEDTIAERCITPVVSAAPLASHMLQVWHQQFKGQEVPSAPRREPASPGGTVAWATVATTAAAPTTATVRGERGAPMPEDREAHDADPVHPMPEDREAPDADLVQHYLEQIRDGAAALLKHPCPSSHHFRDSVLMLSVIADKLYARVAPATPTDPDALEGPQLEEEPYARDTAPDPTAAPATSAPTPAPAGDMTASTAQ